MSDKYYYEPGTERMFRSLISVKRYLNGEDDPVIPRKKPCQNNRSLVPYRNPVQNFVTSRRIVYGGKFLRPDELEQARQAKLDDIVPETLQPRSCSLLPDGWIVEEVPRKCGTRSDRYFIEPVSESSLQAPRTPAPRKKNTSLKMFKTSIIDLTNPPEKINWVFSGDGRDDWSPLVEECMLPDYVKEQWEETFLLGMNGWKHRIPQLTMGKSNRTANA
ncbi:Methyl-CpG-binding domain-containing protein 7 [Bienertia sinuspersici]